jgi:surface antigen
MTSNSLMGTDDTGLIPASLPAASQPVTTASAGAMSDISSYVDAAALKLLSRTSQTQASAAQFNALQFGRVGAPRNWTGDNGASGQVTVGPYIRVNLIDCRDFTHQVTVSGTSYSRKGTACREADGSWTVT